ncbi:MAG: FKBP-type peptidyl-prolyl cis-trans isomerase [Bacteroidales bacterium]|nr:FKBP-type peptidyl-prolyl cis-trans isomerase [Bacteroidales bacterium]
MKKKYYLSTILFLSAFLITGTLFAQEMLNNDTGFITTKSGLKYRINEKGRGIQPKEGDYVYVHYIGKFLNDSVFDDSYKRGYPLMVALSAGQVIKGWEEGLTLLHQGDKATFIVPSELGYGKIKIGNIPANSTLVFDIELLQVVPSKTIEPFKTDGKDTIKTKSGLKYVIISQGKGEKPKNDEIIIVDYSGFLDDGKIFDSSVKRMKSFKFTLGQGQVIKAWDEGLKMIGKGGKIKLIVPPKLAYGRKGYKNIIPAKATLTFDIELLEIIPEIIIKPFAVEGKDTIETETGLKYIDVVEGTGKQAFINAIVTVHYTGYLKDGTIFDSSVKTDEPIQFPLGAEKVIKGWDEGLLHMKEGGKTRLIIPYHLGYGEEGNLPQIPPRATLIFDVELLEVL